MDKEKGFSRPLGDAARKARKERKLSQGKVSELTGIDHRTILNIENYYGNPQLDNLYTLVRFYGLDPIEFFYPERAQEAHGRKELYFLVDTCSDEDALLLIPILRAILKALKSKETIEPDANL